MQLVYKSSLEPQYTLPDRINLCITLGLRP